MMGFFNKYVEKQAEAPKPEPVPSVAVPPEPATTEPPVYTVDFCIWLQRNFDELVKL